MSDTAIKEFPIEKVSGKKLDDVKLERSKDVIGIVVKLLKESKNPDLALKRTESIINTVIDDLDQIFTVGEEIGRRREHDKLTRKLPG